MDTRGPLAASRRDLAALCVLAICTVAGLAMVPRTAWARPGDPPSGAIYGFLVTLVILALCRVLHWPRFERAWLALFLAAMPVVYLRAGMLSEMPLGVEWVGFAIFLALAVGGLLLSPWFLVAGLFAHGLAWDLWHVAPGSVVPRWYAVACAIVDVGLGAHAAARAPLLRRREVVRASG